jgi:Skp family chaperone for outer membrane proteins
MAWCRVLLIVLALGCTAPAFGQTLTALSATPQSNAGQVPARDAFPKDSRIGYVDLERVAALSGEGKLATAQLEALRTKKAAEVAARGKQVEALQQKLTAGGAVLNEAAYTRLQREFQRAQLDFQRFNEDAQAEVQDTQQQLWRAFTTRLFPVVGQVATEKNLWAVFSSESTLLWHAPAIDLSEEVAKRLDAAPPKH